MTELEHGTFSGSDRFQLRGRLGAGAMGVVYRVYDQLHRADVALKTLRSLDGSSLYRFKNEFRSLSGIVHTNLVTLYELQSLDQEWFFTMELVEGESFLQYVRPYEHLLPEEPAGAAVETRSIETATAPTGGGRVGEASSLRRDCIIAAVLDPERLLAAISQLVRGLDALHQAGKVHRDVKPSNVLVDRTGRVVVCDFGLITEAAQETNDPAERQIAGTPVYMSPEQAAGTSLQPASDWYSVGVMLYEALTGRVPHAGTIDHILEVKQTADPLAPTHWDPGVDVRLSDLAMALLARDPGLRPNASTILGALDRGSPTAASVPLPISKAAPFVGRAEQTSTLTQAFADAQTSDGVAVLVSGPSGMGKTTLIRRFLDDAVASDDPLVLEGRCYERESVPYKALDGLVDALSNHLLGLGDGVVDLIPANIGALARLFPVLRRLATLAEAASESRLPHDVQELRLLAFGALGEVLARCAAARPTIVYIDDLQWGDLDSAYFLEELVRRPRAPGLLFIGSYRSDEVDSSALLQTLLSGGDGAGDSPTMRQVVIGELTREESRQLARSVLQDAGDVSERAVDEIAREAEGSPLFVTELARAASRHRGAAGRLNLDDILHRRITDLPDEARALLTATAVAGRPTPLAAVSRAAGVQDEPSALAVLLAEHLVRTRIAGGREEIESSHDRIREVATARLSKTDLRRVHRKLACSLETSNKGDALALVEHWMGAGVPDRAAACAVEAAAQAEETLAFDRAVYHYRLALELLEQSPEARRQMQSRLASALANSGSLAESAETYLQAADGADRSTATELRSLALKNFLRSGRNEEGLEVARDVLRDVGLKLPRSRPAAMLSVVLSRARLALRGIEFRERPAEKIRDQEIRRLDLFWSVGSGLSLIDPVLGTAFQMRNLITALRVGEPYRAALALSMEVGYRSFAGGRARERVAGLIASTRELAEQAGNSHALGVGMATTGLAHFSMGDFEESRRAFEDAERVFSETGVGERWDVDVCRTYRMGTLWYLGRIGEFTESVTTMLREAIELGDAFLARGLRAGRNNAAWLVLDAPDEARRQVEHAQIEAGGRAFHMPQFYRLFALCQIELYRGDGLAAWELMQEAWPVMKRSMLMRRSESIRISAQFLRGRCAIAAAIAAPSGTRSYLASARNAASRLERERNHWNRPKAALVRALANLVDDDRESARAALSESAAEFSRLGFALHAAAARYLLGRLTDGADGRAISDKAESWMNQEGVKHPRRLASLIAPAAISRDGNDV